MARPKPQTQPPPHSFEAEQSVLGAILVRPEVMDRVYDLIKAEDFYRSSHSQIYQAMVDLFDEDKPIDLVTVNERLKNRGQLVEVGGPVFLAGLSEQCGFATNAEYYAGIVREKADLRRFQSLGLLLSRACISGNGAEAGVLAEIRDLERRTTRNRAVQLTTGTELLAQDTATPPEIIGAGLLPQGGGAFLTGDAGIGKSLLTVEIGVRLTHGLPLWGLPVNEAVNVLVVQSENPDYSMRFRLQRILSGLGLSEAPRLFLAPADLRLNLNNPQGRKTLGGLIEKAEAKLTILDPLISYHTTPENDNVAFRNLLDSLTEISRPLGAALLLVHHHGRPQDGETRYRGAAAMKDWADLFLTLSSRKSDGRRLLSLDFVKVRHGPDRPPLTLERDANFIHHVTKEPGIAPPSLVVTALANLGGHCEGKAPLAKEIMSLSGCSRRTAYLATYAATGNGIDEFEEGKKRFYFVQSAIAQVGVQSPVTQK